MTTDVILDPIQNVDTLPGGQLMAACIAAVENQGWVLRHREKLAAERGQAIDRGNLRDAALLAAAAEILAAIKADGDHASAAGRTPPAVVAKAVSAARAAFKTIDRGAA